MTELASGTDIKFMLPPGNQTPDTFSRGRVEGLRFIQVHPLDLPEVREFMKARLSDDMIRDLSYSPRPTMSNTPDAKEEQEKHDLQKKER